MKFPEQYRARFSSPPASRYNSNRGDPFGAFVIPNGSDQLFCIATDGRDPDAPAEHPRWEHVSVSVRNRKGLPVNRCATWAQMCLVKSFFWNDEECVVQYHPAKSEYVNQHPTCLHLWRPVDAELPTPPSIFVGIKTEAIERQKIAEGIS